jgi:hypothetical protein
MPSVKCAISFMTAQGMSEDKAVSLMSVGIDFWGTQVVDGN